ncbi:hypothetical protein [Flavobacterium sp.]|uniref:hypothetical protein n=1 Tax=Flavobacterium sp. TaxID=239 RepID=UPI0025C2FA30|nr:hypothetical protein [Flavobacterium sp.]MBA4153813.1 hypothetical protein [Flavobacterium sp.]
MKNIFKISSFSLFVLCFTSIVSFGQEATVDTAKHVRKNIIRFNLTGPLLFTTDYLVFGYERVLKENQTMSINIGQFAVGKFSNKLEEATGLEINRNTDDFGFNTSIDYRFYLGSVNKYSAPRGVYIGPFYSYNHFTRGNSWSLDGDEFEYQGEVYSEFALNIHTFGFQLGYQFIFWDRMALDLVLIGPGIANYGAKVNLDTTLSAEDEALFFEKFNAFLADKIPGYDQVIEPGEFGRSGSFNTTSAGFRYMIHLGYKF